MTALVTGLLSGLGRAAPYLAGAALLCLFAGLMLLGLRQVETMISQAVAAERFGRDSYWSGQIEKANAQAASMAARQASEALSIETAANDRIRTVEQQLSELETANAALPGGGDCGLDRDRVRLLGR